MKTMKRFFCMLLLAAATTAFIACSDKEETMMNPDGTVDVVYGQWVERGNQLIYSESYDQGYGTGYTMTWTLTFENDICVASECSYIFSSADLAQIVYESYIADGEGNVRRSGNTVIFDFTEHHAGLTKAEAMEMVESMGGLM